MRKLNSEKASQNPLAASQLGAVPVKAGQANSLKAKIGHSRMATMLSPSEIESLRQEAKADHLRVMEILTKQAKEQST